jgi:hypothetical protein
MVIIPVYVVFVDGGLSGPEVTLYYDQLPLLTFYSRRQVNRRFIERFVRTSVDEIRRHGTTVTLVMMRELVREAFMTWQNAPVVDARKLLSDKVYVH